MIELPESRTLARQMETLLSGKVVASVEAGRTPHKFAWYFGDPAAYDARLRGKTVEGARSFGNHTELRLSDGMRLDFNEGLTVSYLEPGAPRPQKHQLLVEFTDGSALAACVRMYGGMMAFAEGENENPYYIAAKEAVDPLSEAFDLAYWRRLLAQNDLDKLSAKAFLATEQRIPGLGNGVLQDILWDAGVNPRARMAALSAEETARLFDSVKRLLAQMTEQGGRDTETGLLGGAGGYKTVMGKNNRSMTCPKCGGGIVKEAYLGGSVYYCPVCQPKGTGPARSCRYESRRKR